MLRKRRSAVWSMGFLLDAVIIDRLPNSWRLWITAPKNQRIASPTRSPLVIEPVECCIALTGYAVHCSRVAPVSALVPQAHRYSNAPVSAVSSIE